ncbi:MAG TPA: DUF402 domain-containing protein [Dehalococcoidia bacterium]|nr:DUF402 domain-containing protein [Dehalococcoidia bacterium]
MGNDGGSNHFRVGETVALRYITRNGKPGMSWPFRVVSDTEDLVALHIPAGATYARWGRSLSPPLQRASLEPKTWRREILRLMYPGRNHSIWLFWAEEEGEREFSAYYVNFEEPFRRTPIGFDTNDHTLDIVVTPTLSWRWKDEPEFEERVRQGIYTPELARMIRKEARTVVEAIERCEAPFSDGWEKWQPDPTWEVPVLPEGWDSAPAMQWEDRVKAYGDARG